MTRRKLAIKFVGKISKIHQEFASNFTEVSEKKDRKTKIRRRINPITPIPISTF